MIIEHGVKMMCEADSKRATTKNAEVVNSFQAALDNSVKYKKQCFERFDEIEFMTTNALIALQLVTMLRKLGLERGVQYFCSTVALVTFVSMCPRNQRDRDKVSFFLNDFIDPAMATIYSMCMCTKELESLRDYIEDVQPLALWTKRITRRIEFIRGDGTNDSQMNMRHLRCSLYTGLPHAVTLTHMLIVVGNESGRSDDIIFRYVAACYQELLDKFGDQSNSAQMTRRRARATRHVLDTLANIEPRVKLDRSKNSFQVINKMIPPKCSDMCFVCGATPSKFTCISESREFTNFVRKWISQYTV